MPRERELVDRVPVDLRAVDLRAVLLRAVLLRAVVLRAVLLRLVPAFALPRPLLVLAALEREPVPADLAERELVLADLADREPVLFADFFAVPLERDLVELDLPALREPALLARLAELRDPVLLPVPPDITRCAASATASAISEPSRVALDITVLAAWLAESAASIPASRIFLRADGLALIAAAAAASPAASISLLIAALVILSTVVSLELLEPDEEREDDFRLLDFAIANLPVRSFL